VKERFKFMQFWWVVFLGGISKSSPPSVDIINLRVTARNFDPLHRFLLTQSSKIISPPGVLLDQIQFVVI